MSSLATKLEIDKSVFVKEIFSRISGKYDLLNNLMTLGLHNFWKKELIKLALKENLSPKNALDLCAGTCDLGIILSKYCPDTNILCVDNCAPMLEIGKRKIQNLKLTNIKIKTEGIENLYIADKSYDLITIGFGLRNLVNKEKCIKSVWRILKDGGVFACLDLGHPKNLIWKKIFYFYFFKLVPRLGDIFAKSKEAYTYLPTSLLSYYTQEELKDLILKIGFKKCFYKNIMGGVVAIHIAVK